MFCIQYVSVYVLIIYTCEVSIVLTSDDFPRIEYISPHMHGRKPQPPTQTNPHVDRLKRELKYRTATRAAHHTHELNLGMPRAHLPPTSHESWGSDEDLAAKGCRADAAAGATRVTSELQCRGLARRRRHRLGRVDRY